MLRKITKLNFDSFEAKTSNEKISNAIKRCDKIK